MFCSMLDKVDHMVVKPVFKQKNAELANTKRLEGNEAFQKKRYKQAAMLYTVSVMKAVAGQETLAYSVANRSACQFYLGDLTSCLQDIQLALSSGYPEQLRYKLYERRAKCHLLSGNFDKARAALSQAKKSLEANRSKLEEKKQSQAKKSLKEISEAISSKRGLAEETIMVEEREDPSVPRLSQGCHKKLRSLSSLVRVEYREGVGRHVVAAKQVQAGDTLAVENPVAAVLYSDKQGTNCDLCTAKLRSAVPCPTCAGVAFCSVECRDEALASYHRLECRHQDILLGLGSSALVRLSYRSVTASPQPPPSSHLPSLQNCRLEVSQVFQQHQAPAERQREEGGAGQLGPQLQHPRGEQGVLPGLPQPLQPGGAGRREVGGGPVQQGPHVPLPAQDTEGHRLFPPEVLS